MIAGLLVFFRVFPGFAQSPGGFPGTLILGTLIDRSITVHARSNAVLEMYFEYGLKSSQYSGQTKPVISAADPFAGGFYVSQTVIGNLQPDTRYYYRVQYRSSGSSTAFLAGTENSFHTQRAPGSTFVFCAQGDSHPERANSMFNSNLYSRTLAAVAAALLKLHPISSGAV